MVVDQYDVFLVNLDPTIGHEIRKTRPRLEISPSEMNNTISTIIVAPMTTRSRGYPSRVPVRFQRTDGWIVLDRIRTIDKRRLVRRLGRVHHETIAAVKSVLSEMLVE